MDIHCCCELTGNDYNQVASYGHMKSIMGGEKTCFPDVLSGSIATVSEWHCLYWPLLFVLTQPIPA